MQESKQNNTSTAVDTSTQRERYYNELWYTIPYHLQRDNTRKIAVVNTYTRKRGLKRTITYLVYKEGQKRAKKGAKKERNREEMKRNEWKGKTEKNHHGRAQGAGRVPRGQYIRVKQTSPIPANDASRCSKHCGFYKVGSNGPGMPQCRRCYR